MATQTTTETASKRNTAQKPEPTETEINAARLKASYGSDMLTEAFIHRVIKVKSCWGQKDLSVPIFASVNPKFADEAAFAERFIPVEAVMDIIGEYEVNLPCSGAIAYFEDGMEQKVKVISAGLAATFLGQAARRGNFGAIETMRSIISFFFSGVSRNTSAPTPRDFWFVSNEPLS